MATVALKGSVMESKLAFAVEPTGLHEAFTRMGFARANFGFVILDKIKTNICFATGCGRHRARAAKNHVADVLRRKRAREGVEPKK